jgi:menaquinone-specific isochorismate synthase
MSVDMTHDNQLDWDIVVRQLVEALHENDQPGDHVHRVEIPIQPCRIIDWIVQQRHDQKLYWSDRNGAVEVAGIGEAAVLSPSNPHTLDVPDVFAYCRTLLSSRHKHQRLYGGFSFADTNSEQWSSFGRFRFVAPAIEVGRDGDDYYAACQWRSGGDNKADLVALLESARLQEQTPQSHIAHHRVDTPAREEWYSKIETLLELFEQGDVDKVVLARESKFFFNDPVEPCTLLQHLRENTSHSYHYAFQSPDGSMFIGASPERLFKRDGELLYSEALAATRPRGATLAEDDALGHELLTSDKDLREHKMVLDRIVSLLDEFCSNVSRDREIEVLKLRHCQHLLCKVGGQLHSTECDADVLEKLHPTPAVGGTPKHRAMDWIAKLEEFDRGWYAAPVGWIGLDAVEFAVAIRSALVQHDVVSVYTGAGIVPGSKPRLEWKEIENKIADFRSLFAPEDSDR